MSQAEFEMSVSPEGIEIVDSYDGRVSLSELVRQWVSGTRFGYTEGYLKFDDSDDSDECIRKELLEASEQFKLLSELLAHEANGQAASV